MKQFNCECSNILFFENSQCLQCGSEVGFDPISGDMHKAGPELPYQRCANGIQHGACNWLLPADSEDQFCMACRLNQVIPDLSNVDNLVLWAKLEIAKRRALYSLLQLGLPIVPASSDGAPGLAFQFLQPTDGAPVLTGHENGLITINLEEADDAIRERNRLQLGEPYRTLLGHFRHEIGHYYWDQWFVNGPMKDEVLPAFRELFGDETADYQQAMQNYYNNGPSPDWAGECISAYASMHPWEDWAETWAHYLHVTDTLETASSFGVRIDRKVLREVTLPADDRELPAPFKSDNPAEVLDLLQRWVAISPAINEISRSLGHTTLYPFALPGPAVHKFHFIHRMIQRQQNAPLPK